MTCNVAPSVTDYLSWSSCSNKPSVPSGGNMNGHLEGSEGGGDSSRPLSDESNHKNDTDAKSLRNSVSKQKHRNDRKEEEYQKAKRELMKNPNFVRFENGWSEHISRSGKHYYFHFQSKKTVWERPSEMSPSQPTPTQTKVSHNLVRIEGEWSEHISSSGNHYYYNSKTKESVWEKPKGFFDSQQNLNKTPAKSGGPVPVPNKSAKDEPLDDMTPNCSSNAPSNVSTDKQSSNTEPSDKVKSSMSRETLKMMIQKLNENHQSSKGDPNSRSMPAATSDHVGLQRKRSYRSSEEIVNSVCENSSRTLQHKLSSASATSGQSFESCSSSRPVAIANMPNKNCSPPVEYQQQHSLMSTLSSLSNGASSTSTALQSSVDHWINHSCAQTTTAHDDTITSTINNSHRSATEDWAFISNYNSSSAESKQEEKIETSAKSGSSKRSRNSHSNQEFKPKLLDIYGAKLGNMNNESIDSIQPNIKMEPSYSPCKKPRRGSVTAMDSLVKEKTSEDSVEKEMMASPEDACQSPGVSEDGIAKPETQQSFTLPPSPQREELPPSMHFYDPELVMHICEWPSASQEAQILKNMQEESKHATQVFQTTVDLKFLRSVVRANEIQATLQQARIHFIREQILELENTNVNLGVGTSIEGGSVTCSLPPTSSSAALTNATNSSAANTCSSFSSLIGQGENNSYSLPNESLSCSAANSRSSSSGSFGANTGVASAIPVCLNNSSKSSPISNQPPAAAPNSNSGGAVSSSSSHFYSRKPPPASVSQHLMNNSSSTSSKLTTSLNSSAAAAGSSLATT